MDGSIAGLSGICRRSVTDQSPVSQIMEHSDGSLPFLEDFSALTPRKSSSEMKHLLATKLLFPRVLRSGPVAIGSS